MRDDPEAGSAAEPDEDLAAKAADAAVRRALVESQRQLLDFLQRQYAANVPAFIPRLRRRPARP